nr:signal peptidase I [Demequina sp. TTPB684]
MIGSVLIWLVVAIDAWFLWPTQLGGATSIVIVSGRSMEPTYFDGDLVIARDMEPSVGDIIIYAPEGLGGSQVVHRIIGGNADEGWQMQGDNNDFVDPFTPRGEEVKGVVLLHYSNFGRVTVLLLNPMVWAFVLLAAMVLMLWYTGDDCDDDDDEDDDRKNRDSTDGDSESEEEPDLLDRVVEGTEAALARMAASVARTVVAAFALATHARRAPRHAVGSPRLAAPAYLRGAGVVAVLGLVAVFGPSIASASQLAVVTSGNTASMEYSICASQALSASPSGTPSGGSYSAVQVTGFAAPCIGESAQVYLYSSTGALLASGAVTSTSASTVFATSVPYTGSAVASAIVKIDGWVFVATWVPPVSTPSVFCVPVNNGGNVPKGGTCTVSTPSITTWSSGGYEWANVSMTVTSSHSDARVTLDLSRYPFPGWTPASINGNGDFRIATLPSPAYQCSQLPIVEFNRNTNNGSWTLYFQMTTQPNAFPWSSGAAQVCS